MRIAGIDPGLHGALAIWDSEFALMDVKDLPVIRSQIKSSGSKRKVTRDVDAVALADLLRQSGVDVAYVELVHSMPKQGVVSTFKFGTTYGLILGVLAGLGVPTHLVRPQEWKARFHLIGKDKNASRLVASRILPANARSFRLVQDGDKAEGSLIALFAAERHT